MAGAETPNTATPTEEYGDLTPPEVTYPGSTDGVEVEIEDAPAEEGGTTEPRAETPSSSSGAAVPKSLEEFFAANPEARAEYDKRINSEVERLRPTLTQQVQSQLQGQALQNEIDQLTDRVLNGDKVNEQDRTRLRDLRRQQQEAVKSVSIAAEREREYARSAVRGVLGVDPPEEALHSYDALWAWAQEKSPRVQSLVKNIGQQQATSTQAQGAAEFGARLAATPAPTTNTNPGSGGTKHRTFRDIERDYVDGKLTFEQYAKARAQVPALSRGALT